MIVYENKFKDLLRIEVKLSQNVLQYPKKKEKRKNPSKSKTKRILPKSKCFSCPRHDHNRHTHTQLRKTQILLHKQLQTLRQRKIVFSLATFAKYLMLTTITAS